MTRYFHGGPRGVWVGGAIVPANELSVPAAETITGIAAEMGRGDIARRDRVYITTSLTAATMFAVMRPTVGVVYEVRPVGELEHDPDCDTMGLSFMCERAIVVRVHFPTPKQIRAVRTAFTRAA